MQLAGEEIFFVNYVKDPSKVLLYAPLRSYLAVVSRDAMNRMVEGTDADAIAQVSSRLQQRPKIDICKLHENVKRASPELSIAITDNCNLKCRYCHHAAGDAEKQKCMSESMISSLYETFFQGVVDASRLRIVFAGGGEPTYNTARFYFAVSRAKEYANPKGIKLGFRMATNGCFSDATRDFIAKEFEEVSLSLDGPRHIQDKHRPFKNGTGSFEVVFRNATELFKAGFPFAFRATVSSYSIGHLRETVDFFEHYFPGKHLGLEPLNPFGRAAFDTDLRPPRKDEFAAALTDIYEYAKGKNIVLVNAAVGKFANLRTVFCGAVGIPNWTVSTTGRLSCCTRDNAPEVFNYGTFDEKSKSFSIDSTRLGAISKLNVFEYPECQNCFCKYHCAGDCPDIRLSGLLNCEANVKLGEYWLNERITQYAK